MLPKFDDDKTVKKELKYFSDEIDKIADESLKQKALTFYNKIKFYTNMIHEVHMSPINQNIDPTDIRRNIDNLVTVRKQLTKLIKDYRS